MKTIFILLATVSALQTFARSKKVSTKSNIASASQHSRLSTDIKFDGQMVGGKVQSPFESLTEVENEKQINDLIGVRRNFDDRILKTKQMR